MKDDFVLYRAKSQCALEPAIQKILPDVPLDEPWKEPNPVVLVTKKKEPQAETAGHYFVGGLPALMQAVRLLQKEPLAHVCYVQDGQIKKSTQSAHQGHVHPTEWTTPELGTWQLTKLILNSLYLMPIAPPDDVLNYSYVHFPLSKIRPGLFLCNIAFKLMRALRSTNNISPDDRWQCEAVRASLAFHQELSDEIVKAGGEPTFSSSYRLIWASDKAGIERKKALWEALGIKTEFLSKEELYRDTLLKEDEPLYGLKVYGDGKFYANVDTKIVAYLSKKYPNFKARTAAISELHIDEETKAPFAVVENGMTYSVDSFFGSLGHNQVFKKGSKKPLWNEVPVTGVSTLWVCTIPSALKRYGSLEHIKQLVGAANLTNLHTTVWDAVLDGDKAHIVVRATEGANFNSSYADPKDLANMTANINRFFIGSWKLITAGSCTRKTTTSNIPELTDHFIHGLSGIGFSFSAVPLEMFRKK